MTFALPKLASLLAATATATAIAFALAGCTSHPEEEATAAAQAPPAEPASFNVGGMLAGLGAGKSVALAHVDAAGATVQSASLNANGSYSLRLPAGTAYNLRVLAQPAGQTCVVSNGTGTVSADVINISVSCLDDIVAPQARPVSGSASGLAAGQTLVLLLTASGASQELVLNANGDFSFAQPVTGTYTVTAKSQPAGQACTVAHGQGVAGEAPAIAIACTSVSTAFKLGGHVSGNIGVVALRNFQNGDTLALNTNGAFTFSQPVVAGGNYSVAVFDQSAGQSCSVAHGSGAANAEVGNIAVTCAAVVAAPPPPPPVPVPATPAGLTMTYGVKSFHLAWGTVTAPAGGGAVTYRVFEDPDGAGPAASAQIASGLAGSTHTRVVTGLLHTRLNAQYTVQACNSSGCSAPAAAIVPNLAQAIGYFKASNTGANDAFGYSLALSADGGTLAVGAYAEDGAADAISDSGAVYLYVRTGNSWVQQTTVKASGTAALDQFGYAVALSANGNTLAVGAVFESTGGVNSGAAYVYTRAGGIWTQQASLKASNADAGDQFGYAVALSGDGGTLAVGAINEDGAATGAHAVTQPDGAGATNSGAVYVYTLNPGPGTWSQQAYVKASNTAAGDLFGHAVALSQDGNVLAVGATGEDNTAAGVPGAPDSGAVYVYARTGGVSWGVQAYVKAPNAATNDNFGWSVALSADGNTLAAGAAYEDSASSGTFPAPPVGAAAVDAGAAYVFTRSGASWTPQAYVKASNTAAGDRFGWSLALSSDGNTLAVAAFFESSAATGIHAVAPGGPGASGSGAAYLYTRTAGAWTQQAYLKASNTGGGDFFGTALALSADGSTLAVGAQGEDGAATGIGGNQADNSSPNAGAVYLY